MEPVTIGELLRQLREEAGLTQREAARMASTTQARVSYLENDVGDPKLSTLYQYTRALGFEIEFDLVPVHDAFDKALYSAIEELEEDNADREEGSRE